MGLFSTIMEKLGFKPEAAAAAEAAPAAPPKTNDPIAVAAAAVAAVMPAAAAAMPVVDVVGKLTAMAGANPQKLNWRESIVDLLKLLGLDSSLDARKKLAAELSCPPDKMGDSAQMNIWLHKTVLAKLAANGGNIPKELL